ncbi:hypothetical protein [Sphaerisporangium fuscum]|uniref:hypothetical protein n=1 Tax=Sphaerisporangium fuscum TaxID=2835868 RepID=UPI001BDBFDC3|nr:hypothetical protein [Sphaerisporangium fuscum]
MVSKRRLTLLGPALLSAAVWSAGTAQASVTPHSTGGGHRTTAGVVRALPQDQGDYLRGYKLGYRTGKATCSSSGSPGGNVSADFERGFDVGLQDGKADCKGGGGHGKTKSHGKTERSMTTTEETSRGGRVVGRRVTTIEEGRTSRGAKITKRTTTTTTEERGRGDFYDEGR